MSKEKLTSDVNRSNATEKVRSECARCARHQGGTELSVGNEYSRPQTSAEDIASGDRANADPMARNSRDEWSTRDDQPGHYDYMD